MKPLVDFIRTPRKDIRVIVRRKRGKAWYADFFLRGTRHRVTLDADSGAKALVLARGEVLKALDKPAASPAQLSLVSAIQLYLDARWPLDAETRKPLDPDSFRSRKDASARLNALAAVAGLSLDLAELDFDGAVAMLQRFIQERRDRGDKQRNLVNFKNVLSAFCQWLLTTRGVANLPLVPWRHNPTRKEYLPIGRAPKTLKPSLTEAELRAFFAAARKPVVWQGASTGPKAARAKIAPRKILRSMLLCFGAGARPVEAARVKWSEVNFDAGTIILRGKKRPREIGMNAWLKEQLLRMCPPDFAPDETVIGGGRNAQATALTRLKKIEKLPAHFDLQALRRTAAKKAAPKMELQHYADYFGHSLAVAQAHYIGYGLTGIPRSVEVLRLDEQATLFETVAETVPKKAKQGA